MASQIKEYHLLHIEDYQGARTYSLNTATVSIGRDASNNIVISDPLASIQHALLVRVPAQTTQYRYEIFDGDGSGNSSTIGLSVNQSICDRQLLVTGDHIQIGSTRLCYMLARMTPTEYRQYFEVEQVVTVGC